MFWSLQEHGRHLQMSWLCEHHSHELTGLHVPQIHKATLSEWGAAQTGKAAGTVVAVKVRHPGVSTMMQRDFVLMQRAAALSAKLPVLRDLNLEESVRQFGAPLREQLDLSSEVRLAVPQRRARFASVQRRGVFHV